MSAHNNVAPIIIKKKKVTGGDGHHGGAWKVAYADFVTAMMAFFLLMWLLNATTEQQRKGLADYFSPTIPINRISGGGDGEFGGSSVFSEEVLPQNGTGATNQRPTESQQARGEMGVSAEGAEEEKAAETKALEELEETLTGRAGESTVSRETRRHILTRVTDEGLVIEMFDLPGSALFQPGTDTPTELLTELAALVASVSALVENGVAVEGHTRAEPVILKHNPVWDLSTARANRMRQMLQSGDLGRDRIQRITGHADREPVVNNPMAIRNNRLEVILLRSDH
ncbi:flagellar motor protein MotB [Roseovarius sp. 2305UL8-3]|uniref:flagellar motor protein MotB n=1 Tax=Roseovarius conchicola TaxID=3121636 RepID=UPI003529767D